jgi:hypothetical protein
MNKYIKIPCANLKKKKTRFFFTLNRFHFLNFTFRIMKLLAGLPYLVFLVNLTVANASSRSRKKQNDLLYFANNERAVMDKAKRNLTFMDGKRTCNNTLNPTQTVLYCFNKGIRFIQIAIIQRFL